MVIFRGVEAQDLSKLMFKLYDLLQIPYVAGSCYPGHPYLFI